MSAEFRLAASLCCGRYQRTPPRFFTAHLKTNLVPKFNALRRSLGTPLVNREVSLRADRSLAMSPHLAPFRLIQDDS